MLKAVLFDMDGVVVNTEPLHHKAYYKMFADVEIEVSATLYESFTGQSTIEICNYLVTHFQLKEAPETLMKLKRKHFKYLFENDRSLTLIDGVLACIKNYYNNGLSLVLASSASMPNINRIFKRFDLDQYFVAKLSGADLKASKPHPEIFINAAKASGYKKEECVVIEDSTNGMQAAKRAGIFCIGYHGDPKSTQDFSLANHVIKDFSEIEYSKLKNLIELN